MKKEDIGVVAQILSAMRDSAEELEKALKKKDEERVMMIKKEIAEFSEKLGEAI